MNNDKITRLALKSLQQNNELVESLGQQLIRTLWIDVNDKHPQPNEMVLAKSVELNKITYYVASYVNGEFRPKNKTDMLTVTHWKYLD